MSGSAATSSRMSHWYYTSEVRDRTLRQLTRANPAADSSYGRMFLEDASSLLPYGDGGDDGFTVTITGSDTARTTSLITRALASRSGGRTLTSRLRSFFTVTAELMLTYGKAHYELVYLLQEAGEATGPPSTFGFELIPPGSVHRRRGHLVQYVPPRAAEKHTRKGVGIIALPPDAVIEFLLAADLARQVRHILQVLEVGSGQILTMASMVTDQGNREPRIGLKERVGAENAVRALDLQRSALAQRRYSTCPRSWRSYLNAFRRSADGLRAPRAPVIIRAGQRHGRDFRTDRLESCAGLVAERRGCSRPPRRSSDQAASSFTPTATTAGRRGLRS